MILDDFNLGNILGLLNYTSGIDFVRNFILFSSTSTNRGYNYFWYDTSLAFYVYKAGVEYLFTGTFEEIVEEANAEGDISEDLFFRIVEDFDGHDNVVLVETKGLEEYRDYYFKIRTLHYVNPGTGSYPPYPATGSPVSAYVKYNHFPLRNSTAGYISTFSIQVEQQFEYFTLMPYGDNQIFKAEDATSVLSHGRKLLFLTDDDTVTDPLERQNILDAKLSEMKDPKARCFIDVPFDYCQIKELDLVTVRLSYQSDGQLRAFKEGGHFKGWADSGTYRYKNFYVVGISHSKEGKHTRLRLMEKLD